MTKPFIVAEMSGNHNKSLEKALQIVDAAAECGCDAIKLQTYTADTMTIDSKQPEFLITDEYSLWKNENLYSLYKKASTPYEWHKTIFNRCKEKGIIGFSTPFDTTSVDFLESINCPIYKIASFENEDYPLLKRVAQTKKAVIMSLGMLNIEQITESIRVLTDNGCTNLSLLKCTSTYPANPKDSNILTITDLKNHFPKYKIGLSDHTTGIGVSIAAIALGAEIIEKHFIISKNDKGVDSEFSLDQTEMSLLINEGNKAYNSLGTITYKLSNEEKKSLKYKRSIYAITDIKEGEKFTNKNIKPIRPGLGLHPKYYENIIGKVASCEIKFGTPLKMEHIKNV